jgi:hypothetical protein
LRAAGGCADTTLTQQRALSGTGSVPAVARIGAIAGNAGLGAGRCRRGLRAGA